MKRLSAGVTIVGCVTLLSCDNAVEPPTIGGIDLRILTLVDSPAAAAETEAAAVGQAAEATLALDSGRVIVTGPTSKTVSATPGQTVVIDALLPGSYTVRLEGWEGDEITHAGTTTDIQVTAGENSPADVLFGPTDLRFAALGDMSQLNVNAGGATVSWVSSDRDVATVDASGLVAAVSNGQATITATSGTSSVDITVTVAQEVAEVTVTPATATIDPGQTQQFTATALDANSNPVTGVNILWISSNHNVATVDQAGLASGVGGGIATITAAARGEPGSAALNVTPIVLTAAKLAFTTDPTDAQAGAAIAPAVTVAIQDAFGNTVTSATDAVTLAIETNPGGGTLSGTTTVNAIAGVASFTDISINRAASGYRLMAISDAPPSSAATATSAAFGITPAAAAQLAFVLQSGNGEPQAVLTPAIQVAIEDAFGNTVTSATDLVNVAIGTNPSGGVLSGTAMVAAVGGVATFNDLAIDAAGNGYTLDATSGVLAAGSSTPFDLFLDFTQVTIGDFHSCGVTTNGNAWCWGFNGEGQLGDGANTQQSAPVMVLGGHQWASLDAGARYTCGVRTDGAAFCWGKALGARLGNGTTTPNVNIPEAVLGGHTYSSVSAGNDFTSGHTCGVRATDNAVLCWGSGNNGRLGNGATTGDFTTPDLVLGGHTFSSVSAGSAHTCGIRDTDNAALCWGSAADGRLGNGVITPDQSQPVVVLGGDTFVSVSAGDRHSCGVRTDGAALCWGFAANGRLGDNQSVTDRPTPTLVAGGIHFSSVIAGRTHTCGVAEGSNAAVCWGDAFLGRLGNATTTPDQLIPVAVFGSLQFFSLSTLSNGHSCGVTTSGTYCWGNNGNAQGGNGTTTSTVVPTRVIGTR